MDLLSAISVGLKVVGAFVSLVAGLTALYTPTEEKKLTSFGKGVLTALVVGALCSGSGAFLDYAVKRQDDAKLKSLRLAAEATRLTTADATLYLSITIEKSLPALAPLMSKLESALKYAKQNCRSPGSVANCKDYIIRSVIIDEIRFKSKSQLFPSLSSDPQAYGILTSLGVIVRFYSQKLKPTKN